MSLEGSAADLVCKGQCCLGIGESGVDQLVEIIKVLGTPTREEIQAMNPNYTQFKFPQIKAHPWTRIFHKRMPQDGVDLVKPPPFTPSPPSIGFMFSLPLRLPFTGA